MKRTPAPVSTACAAASIWSGVGEVKTWPGQAASSMPWPTKPVCSGSWPGPPPAINAGMALSCWAGRIGHALAYEAGVQRLVGGAAAGDQRDLALLQVAAPHEGDRFAEAHDI